MPNLPAPETIEGPGSRHSYRLHHNALPLFCYAFHSAQDVNGKCHVAIGFQVGVQKRARAGDSHTAEPRTQTQYGGPSRPATKRKANQSFRA